MYVPRFLEFIVIVVVGLAVILGSISAALAVDIFLAGR